MANIFKEQKAVNEHPKRNNFDLSKKSNVSLKFGTLYPVYCQPVIPGDSFSIETAFNLKLLPVVFPVQTKMRAHMHYFYVRNKNLWSNWENWISNLVSNSEHPHPYLSLPDSKFKSGSIHDFLGVPTSLVGDSPHVFNMGLSTTQVEAGYNVNVYYCKPNVLKPLNPSLSYNSEFSSTFDHVAFHGLYESSSEPYDLSSIASKDISFTFSSSILFGCTVADGVHVYLRFVAEDNNSVPHFYPEIFDLGSWSDLTSDVRNITFNISDNDNFKDWVSNPEFTNFQPLIIVKSTAAYVSANYDEAPTLSATIPVTTGFQQYSSMNIPLYSNLLHINALPYRAYESIYYCYYNNNVLHPLTLNGQVQYNRYNTNLGDGADSTDYHLFQRNYELDFLTSSLPSPQQGVAPLVGMTALGDITIEDENGITTAHADIDNDGTITKVVLTSPAASNEHARVAMNMASCGMSINDFRQTNALQRMLETNIRKGYRYMDFIAGHFGKEPEYRELDMPEFIGGFSRDVSVSTVVSNADTLGVDSGAALGEYGGYAQVIGGSNHAVRHYCDDFGYIIGILSVVPTPCYSQLLPKHMIAPDNFLDYPFPEFMQSGLMPITYKEVAPIQSYIDSLTDPDKRLEDTFGYQRPNYDLVSSVDEVHGEFRGSLRDYVINRIFSTRPELGQDFISINPEEINDIFVNRDPDEDTIIGEIGFSVHAKRPVPRVVIPNLGR